MHCIGQPVETLKLLRDRRKARAALFVVILVITWPIALTAAVVGKGPTAAVQFAQMFDGSSR
ncbi:hypothetical protein D3C76_1678310 [compost metagenome]